MKRFWLRIKSKFIKPEISNSYVDPKGKIEKEEEELSINDFIELAKIVIAVIEAFDKKRKK